MLVSTVIPSFKIDSYSDLADAIDSLLNQSYADIEVVAVIHTNKNLYKKIVKAYGTQTKVKVIFNE
ncbi:unnamed protein product [marine sediment metagenome]|uniref:Glycosyltransferase 2-like domain-containing protein n=1 Tax=marine sediment metagenome TaxID=412755 RepID=X1LTT8_9ZZZZ